MSDQIIARSWFNRPSPYLEIHLDEGKVEKDGVMPTEDLIHMFQESGQRIQAIRGYMYPSEKDVPEDAIPDEGNPGRVEGEYRLKLIAKKIKSQIDEYKNKLKMENDQKAAAAAAEDAGGSEPPDV